MQGARQAEPVKQTHPVTRRAAERSRNVTITEVCTALFASVEDSPSCRACRSTYGPSEKGRCSRCGYVPSKVLKNQWLVNRCLHIQKTTQCRYAVALPVHAEQPLGEGNV